MDKCIKQAELLMLEETMKEIYDLLSSGKLTLYPIETRNRINRNIYNNTGRFSMEGPQAHYRV